MNYLIDFKNTATKQEIDEYLSSNNCTFIKQFSSFENTVLVECSNIPTVTSLVENVTENQDLAVQLLGYPNAQGKDYPEAKFTTEDEDNWWKLAGFMRLDFNLTTQSLPRRGKSAIVYLVDSGIKSDHRDFENADIEHLFSFNQDFVDYNGHGTALASLLCGEVCSVSCPIVKSVKIFQAGVPTLQSDLLAAFDAIINDVKDNPGKLHIINLSWAVPKNEFIENKIKILLTCGALVVASAGNNGIPIENVTPASMKDVITVGAYDKNFYPCNFSNYTGNLSTNPNEVNYGMLDVWAPGELIRIARHIGDGYGNESGTSLSAAICSAALAYNSFMFELVDGTIPFYATDNQTDLRYSIVMKHDYLTLSDKYSGSTKSIVSFVQSEKDDETIKYGKMVGVHTMYYSDEKISTLLAPGTAYKSAYLDFNLPDGLYANDKYLYGSVTNDSNEPLVVSGTMNRIRFDDSIEQSLFNLVILPKTVTDKMTWFNDPVQNLVLHNMFIYEPQFCDGGCVSTGYCFDLGAQCGEKYVMCVCTNSICP